MKGLVDIEVTIPNSKVVYRLSLDRKVSILSGGKGLKDILKRTYMYADTTIYSNWEKFYTTLLRDGKYYTISNNSLVTFNLDKISDFNYSKSSLDGFFLEKDNVTLVYQNIGDIDYNVLLKV